MDIRSRDAGALLIATLALVATGSPARAGFAYTVVDLGVAGSNSYANAINNNGQVVGGTDSPTSNGFYQAALFSGGTVTNLGTLGGSGSNASAINASGQIVGQGDQANLDSHGFSTTSKGGPATDLGTLQPGPGQTYSSANAINNAGVIVGSTNTSTFGIGHAFIQNFGGAMRDLSTMGLDSTQSSQAFGINNNGVIVGTTFIAGMSQTHAFVLDHGALSYLGDTNFASFAIGINDSGQVIGMTYTAKTPYQAFLYDPTSSKYTILGTLGGSGSAAYAINKSGVVVGDSDLSNGSHVPYVYQNGMMTDLNSLIAPGSNFAMLNDASGINDAGVIVGYGTRKDGTYGAYELIPQATVPEPGSLLLVGIGGLVTLGYTWRSRRRAA